MNAKSAAALLTLAVTAGTGAIPAMALSGARAAGGHTVVLEHKRFLPATVSLRRGESVTWLWRDGNVRHNVVGHGFQSRVVTHGSFTVRFARSGTYSYTCTIHPHMDGKVVVH